MKMYSPAMGAQVNHLALSYPVPRTRWLRPALGAALLAPPTLASAQGAAPPPILRQVTISRQGIFDSAEVTGWMPRLVNRLHRTTRASVVDRELLFRAGEPYDSARIAESARNLRALGLFRRVEIDTVTTAEGLTARVATGDGWSTDLGATLQQGNQGVAWSGELMEENLLGTGARLLTKLSDDVDRTTVHLEFSRPRLIADRIGAALAFEHRSDGRQYAATITRPFRSVSEGFGAGLSVRHFDGRLLGYVNGATVPRDTVERRATSVHGYLSGSTRAEPQGYLRVGGVVRIQREEHAARNPALRRPTETVVAIGPTLEWRRVRFLVTRGFQGLLQAEDVDVGLRVRAELLMAPRWLGSDRSGIGSSVSLRLGAIVPAGFAQLEGRIGGLLRGGAVDSGTVRIGGTASFGPGRTRHRLMLHGERSWARGPALGREFELGYTDGLRGFRAHAFTGDRAWFATAEYRFTLSGEIGKLSALGVAAFIERGGAWFQGSPARTGTDAGVGLRLGSTRRADVRASRIDLVRRFASDVERAGWVIVVGKGFTFGSIE